MRVLLVEPDFPVPLKSKNHKNFLPIGLLKIASYQRKKGNEVKLIRGTRIEEARGFTRYDPDEIWITSLFTYWAPYVRDAVIYYKNLFPEAKIKVGGIYASLFSEDEVKEYTGCDEVCQGVMEEAEKCVPAYDLLNDGSSDPIDYQIVHTSRGCVRKCKFCGTWRIEPHFYAKKSIKDEIKFKKIVFYDNNLLASPYIENILKELIELKKTGDISWCESQSGFDGRILTKNPYLAKMLKEAGFRYPRIAWDWGFKEWPEIEKQINILKDAGYNHKDLYIFMLYNWDIQFEEMEQKRLKCLEWGIQIADCRFRPLNQLYDNFDSAKEQTSKDYYIHPGWNDRLVKQFRKNVRRQNICIRQGFIFYSNAFEHKKFDRDVIKKAKKMKDRKDTEAFLSSIGADFWFPDEIHYPENDTYASSASVK